MWSSSAQEKRAATLITSSGATFQNYCHADANRPAPRWLAAGLVGLMGAVLSAILVAAVASTGTDIGVSPQTLATLPAVTTQDNQVAPAAAQALVGQAVVLRLDTRDDTPHTFTIHELTVDILMPAGKSALALFTPTKAGAPTITCDFYPAMQA